MRIKEQWKQPVKSSEAWKAILATVLILVGISVLGPIIFHSRFERLSWIILLLALWAQAAMQVFKARWRAWQPFQALWLASYTFLAGGNILAQGLAALWLKNIGAFLLLVSAGIMIFDFRKPRKPVSSDTAPPA